jgi:hypothetical protein
MSRTIWLVLQGAAIGGGIWLGIFVFNAVTG